MCHGCFMCCFGLLHVLLFLCFLCDSCLVLCLLLCKRVLGCIILHLCLPVATIIILILDVVLIVAITVLYGRIRVAKKSVLMIQNFWPYVVGIVFAKELLVRGWLEFWVDTQV